MDSEEYTETEVVDEAEYSDDFEEDDDDDEDDDRNDGDDDNDNDGDNEEEEEEGGDKSQLEHNAGVPSSSSTQEELKSRKKFPGRKFKFSLKPGESSSKASYEELREKTDHLQEEKEAAQSKMMKLEKCTEIEAVEERDDLQAIVIKLQNTIEDLTIQLKETQSELEEAKSSKVQGWLWKRGVKGPTGRNWRYRWFTSENDGRLYYYRKGNQLTLRGFIDLDKITEVQDLPASEQNVENSCFSLVLPSRTYEMKAKDQEEKLSWLDALEHLTKWAKRKAS